MEKEHNGADWFFPIYGWMTKLNITWSQRAVYALVFSFTNNKKDFYMTADGIASELDINYYTVIRAIGFLEKNGLLTSQKDGARTYLFANKPNNEALSQKTYKPVKLGRFVKPSVQEIADYCRQRGNNIDAVEFYDHYEANGWKIGKCQMNDWRAAVRNWEKKRTKDDLRTSQPYQPRRRETTFQHNRRVLKEMYGYDVLGGYDIFNTTKEKHEEPDEQ